MANLSVTWDNLKDRVGYFLGWGDSDDWSTDQEAQIERCVNDGYRTFLDAPYQPGKVHRWSFLEPRKFLTLNAPYTTGTIGISSGVVTLTGGTFPSWADQGRLVIDGGTYEVNTRDGNTQLTLQDTSVDLTAGASYELQRVTYDLPDDFGGFGAGPITNESENFTGLKEIQRVSEAAIRSQNDYANFKGYPRMAAHFVESVADNTTDAFQRWVIEFYPSADQAYNLSYTYIVLNNALSDTNTRPLGNQRYHDCLIASCLAQAEMQVLDGTSNHWGAIFYQRLASCVAWDKLAYQPRSYGRMQDGSDDTYAFATDWERPLPPGDTYTPS